MNCPYGDMRQHLDGTASCEDRYCALTGQPVPQTDITFAGVGRLLLAVATTEEEEEDEEEELVDYPSSVERAEEERHNLYH